MSADSSQPDLVSAHEDSATEQQKHHKKQALLNALHFQLTDFKSKADSLESRISDFFRILFNRLCGRATKEPYSFDLKEVIHSIFPITEQLETYNGKTASQDIIAGVTIAFVLIPQAIAYSGLAKVEPIQALVSAIFPVIIYALFGGSKHLSIGPEALSSVLFGQAIGKAVESELGSPTQIAAILTFLVAIICLALSILQAGFIDNILSGYLLVGFVLGVSNLIMIEQLPELLGLHHEEFGNTSTIDKLVKVVQDVHSAHLPSLLLGIFCVVFLLSFQTMKKHIRHYNKKHCAKGRASRHPLTFIRLLPQVLVLVFVSLILSFALKMNEYHGIRTLGHFNSNIPTPVAPQMTDIRRLESLMLPAVIITICGFIESQTVTRNFGLKFHYFPSGNRELFAFGACNLVGSCLGAYVTFGSLPRSKILANSGGKTMMAGLFAALIVLLAVLTMKPVLEYLPRPTLAAVVFVAAYNLIEWKEIGFAFRMRAYSEIFMFLSCWIITLFTTIDNGVIFSLILAVLIIMRRTTSVDMVLMGRIRIETKRYSLDTPTTSDQAKRSSLEPIPIPNAAPYRSDGIYRYVDIKEHPEAELIHGVLIISVQAPLLFYNAGRIRRMIDHLCKTEKYIMHRRPSFSGTRPFPMNEVVYEKGGNDNPIIILDFRNCLDADSSALHTLKCLVECYHATGTEIVFSGLHSFHYIGFDNAGLSRILTDKQVFVTLPEAVNSVLASMREKAKLEATTSSDTLGFIIEDVDRQRDMTSIHHV